VKRLVRLLKENIAERVGRGSVMAEGKFSGVQSIGLSLTASML
jgi:hypothetical protein